MAKCTCTPIPGIMHSDNCPEFGDRVRSVGLGGEVSGNVSVIVAGPQMTTDIHAKPSPEAVEAAYKRWLVTYGAGRESMAVAIASAYAKDGIGILRQQTNDLLSGKHLTAVEAERDALAERVKVLESALLKARDDVVSYIVDMTSEHGICLSEKQISEQDEIKRIDAALNPPDRSKE